VLSNAKYGRIGIALGFVSLFIAVVSFWAGPFSPQPTFETSIAEKAASIKQATLDALNGKEVVEQQATAAWDTDRIISVEQPP